MCRYFQMRDVFQIMATLAVTTSFSTATTQQRLDSVVNPDKDLSKVCQARPKELQRGEPKCGNPS